MQNAAPQAKRGILFPMLRLKLQPTSVEWMRFSMPGIRFRLLVSLLSARYVKGKRRRNARLFQRRHDYRSQAHFLGEPARRPLLVAVEHCYQWPRGDRKPFDGSAVEHDREHPMADPPDEAGRLGASLLLARDAAQGCFDGRPIGLLSWRQPEHAFDAHDIDRG